jgi:hypothetical protein
MRGGYPDAAARLRRDTTAIAERALEAAVDADPTLKSRHGQVGLRQLLRDTQLLVERLAMCVGSGDSRWLVQYAEWLAPIYRRRRVSLLDLRALGEGIRATAIVKLEPGERAVAERSLDAAMDVLRRNGRIGGDQHKRSALLKWMYRGV